MFYVMKLQVYNTIVLRTVIVREGGKTVLFKNSELKVTYRKTIIYKKKLPSPSK